MTPGAPGRGSSARLPLEGFRVGPAGHRGHRKTFLSESLVKHKALTNISGEGAEEITGGLPQARAAGTSDGRVRGAGGGRQVWQRPPPLQGGPRDDGVLPVRSDLRHGGRQASDAQSREGCCTIALSCVVGGSRLVSPVLPFPFGGRCVGRLGAATNLTACFAQAFLFDLWRSSGLPHPTHRYPRRPCHATVSRGVATKRTDLRVAVSSSSMASDPTPPLGFSFLLCAGGGTQRRQRHGNNGNDSDNNLGKNGYLSTNGTSKSACLFVCLPTCLPLCLSTVVVTATLTATVSVTATATVTAAVSGCAGGTRGLPANDRRT